MLQIDSISCKIGATLILNNISFSFGESDFISIVGPNGSGKTTLLRCLLGLIPSAGSILLNQKDIKEHSRKEIARLIGYVPQLTDTIPGLSVEQFVALGRYAHHNHFTGSNRSDSAAIELALKATKTTKFSERQVSSLSGGERQRVLLAAVLAQESKIIVLDEPASYLDPKHAVELYDLLQQLHTEYGKGICLVSHDINSAAQVSKRIIALLEGRIEFDGSSEQFMTREVLEKIYQTPFSVIPLPNSSKKFALAGSI